MSKIFLISNLFKFLFLFFYIFVIGEIGIRTISYFVDIYDIEMLKYAKKLKKSSNNPNLSHEHISNSQSKLMGVNIILNSLGHRNDELSIKKNINEYRIHIIGSSITLGWGVKKENTFSSILEKDLNLNVNVKEKYNSIFVINAGIGNTNTQHHFQLFKNQFNLTKPDTIILQYFINDAEIIKKKKNNLILKHSYFAAFMYQQIRSYLFHGSLDDYYVKLYDKNSQSWIIAKKSIKNLKNLCNKNNINFIILFIPDLHNFSENNKLINLYSKINNEFTRMNIPVINTYDSLSKTFKSNPRDSWVSKKDPHPNSKAHEIIGKDLYNFFIKQKIFYDSS